MGKDFDRQVDYELVRRAQAGCQDAVAQMCERHKGLVGLFANRYHSRGAERDDIVQEGFVGLLRAIQRFDPDKGHAFATYAPWWIRQSMSRFVKGPTHLIHLPEYIHNRISRLRKALKEYDDDLDLAAQEIGVTYEAAEDLMRLSYGVSSIHSYTTGQGDVMSPDGHKIMEDSFRLEDAVEREHMKDEMRAALHHLSDREREVIKYRFGLEDIEAHTLAKLGRIMEVSRERIRQIERDGLLTLQEHIVY